MAVMTGGQALVAALAAHDVETVFGMPGSHSLAVYDALVDEPAIRHISIRHEQGAAFMADGYARSTGKVGVCLTTTGPAALNTFAALSTSYTDSCAVLLLCTQIPSEYIGKDKGIYHEIPDQLGMLERLTKFSARAESVQQIADLVGEALRRASEGRPRPVALELPADVLNEESEVTIAAPVPPATKKPDAADVEQAVSLIAAAERPILWIGGGVISGDASEQVARLAETLQAPVLTTALAHGAMPADHPLHLGFIAVKKPVEDYLAGCDLMVAIGTRFSFISTERWTTQFPQRMIHIDADATMIGKNYPATLGIVADAREALEAIVERLDAGGSPARESRAPEVRELKEIVRAGWEKDIPRECRLIQAVQAALPRDTIVCGGPTMASYLAWRMLDFYEPRTYAYPMGCATLGYAMPAALGAKIAHPDRPVVAMCGDGGFMFTCQELATAVQYGIKIVVLLFNDNGYEVLRLQQQQRFGRHSAVDLHTPDFVAMARSYGADGFRVEPDQLGDALKSALVSDKPVLIEIPVALAPDTITA